MTDNYIAITELGRVFWLGSFSHEDDALDEAIGKVYESGDNEIVYVCTADQAQRLSDAIQAVLRDGAS